MSPFTGSSMVWGEIMKKTLWSGLRIGVSAAAILAAVTGCGTVAASTGVASAATRGDVATVTVNKTAQVLAGTLHAGSKRDEAVFVLTARTKKGSPAANQPVTFYIGPMAPLSGVGPAHWYASGTSAAKKYVASYTDITNKKGEATLVLLGQPTNSMEMVGVRIGNLSSYNVKTKKVGGVLDAWWTSPSATRTAPVGDYVTTTPFLTSSKKGSQVGFAIGVYSSQGPIQGAHVTIGGAGMGSGTGGSTMMGSSNSTAMPITQLTTSSSGMVTDTIMEPNQRSVQPARIVVTAPKRDERIAGGMSVEWLASN